MDKKEYIERGALIAAYDRAHKGPPGGARKLMEDAPAADVVEVVRCKDCVHYRKTSTKDEFVCSFWDFWCYPLPNSFCGYGERKNDERKID